MSPKILHARSLLEPWKITTLTFQGDVTSSVTWSFNSQVAISDRRSIVTKLLSPAVTEIMDTKRVGVTTLTFLGHVRHRSRDQLIPRYPFPIGAPLSPSVYLQPFPRYCALSILDLLRSLNVIGHVTIGLWMGHFLSMVLCTQVSISNSFRDILPQTSCAHRHNAESSLHMRDITALCKIFKYIF